MAPASAASEQPVAPVAPVAAPYMPPPPPPREAAASAEAAFNARDGIGGGRPAATGAPPPHATHSPTDAAPAPAPANRGGLPLALDEKQLKVTLMLYVVKLVSPK